MKFMCVYKSIHKYFYFHSTLFLPLFNSTQERINFGFHYCAKSETFVYSFKSSSSLSLSRSLYASTTFLRSSLVALWIAIHNRYQNKPLTLAIWMSIETVYLQYLMLKLPSISLLCRVVCALHFNNAPENSTMLLLCPCPCTCIHGTSISTVACPFYTLSIVKGQ